MTLNDAIDILGKVRKVEIQLEVYNLWISTLEEIQKKEKEIPLSNILGMIRSFKFALEEKLRNEIA